MLARELTKQINVGNIKIGGQNKVLIQSMCNIKTSKVEEVSNQINRCALLGADLMRLSCLDMEDAIAFKEIKKRVSIPLIADIHFDYKLALKCMESGVDAIRINPGNIGNEDNVKKVLELAKEKNIPIRVGVNSGSLDKEIHDYSHHYNAKTMVESAKKLVATLEKYNFTNIVISLKGSSVLETIEAYRLASKEFKYPLHLGITEAGPLDVSLIRSTAGLAPLLLEGIGDTIRISITGNPEDEVKAAKSLLNDIGLYENTPTFVSCPTCGRTQVNLIPLAKKVEEYLETINKKVTVACMGCIVNGPGEAKNADLGIAGGKGEFVLFKKGQIIKKIKEEDAFDALKEEIDKF